MTVGTEVAATCPKRWDAPLDARMRSLDVDHLLRVAPFSQIDPAAFPATLPLHEILRNDARIVRCLPGDLIVREGDYGHSAFLILLGRVRIVLSGLSDAALGRQEPHRLSWREAVAQLGVAPRRPRRVLSKKQRRRAPVSSIRRGWSASVPRGTARGYF